ncbi:MULTISPECIES: chorismate mutase family protein [Streptomycetaceae]|uniref:Chorismate mutase n=1 Tax=Streptantibioticus cattleyicolor (strain ATCC 35852 / DSM 46488 / JCM 4925 / NBRC 14057 / NRRL 8057) TaxID=1003195 RepID=F8K3B9_STREN|nr:MULTISPECIES: chorismate mutase [Streptomycetaceae]AEW95031.1 hypothetical protein SCATT_26600 [Streptantibioticus cattleyicolor NRRL 8057 = DSM 46488]MYS59630.1 chorismate mutase [Streptomyces sp. SID5468]CCB75383.1 Monofunctional chorismate mutase [Streptantibioticus cattleyicolor NRRL 8057 = DSM 46488]
MTAVTDTDITARYEHIAELDRSIIGLVRERSRALGDLGPLRRAAGLSQGDLARENEMLLRYHSAFGQRGTALGLLLLELARTTPSAR